MLRYKTETRPGLVALYDIQPGNGAGQFLQPRSPHGGCMQWRRSVVKYGGQGQSSQAIKLFHAPRKKISFTFHFWHRSFILDDVKLAELSSNSFE